MTHYVAIDIGGTNIKYGLIDQEGQLVESHEMPTEAHKGGPHILQKTKDIVVSYLEKGPVAGVAISSAGMVDPDKGEIFYAGPQIPNYAGTQFKKEIETSFAIPCEIENDVNCAGLAEAVSGSGKGASVTLCLTIGTGIGGTYGAMPELFLKLNQLIADKDLETARELQYAINAIIGKLTAAHGNMYGVIKEVLKINEGLNIGSVRSPLTPVTEEDRPVVEAAAQLIRETKERFL